MLHPNLWSLIPQPARQRIESQSQRLELKRGDFVYRAGEIPQGIYAVTTGLVGLVVLAASGREHLLRFFRAQQFFGHRSLFSEEKYHSTAVVLEPTSLHFIPKSVVFETLDSQPALYRSIVSVLAKELRDCELQRVMVLENQILTRVAQSLVFLKGVSEDYNWTRQEIANFCASTPSTVIKALAELETLGLISQNGRSISMLDREKLLALQDQN